MAETSRSQVTITLGRSGQVVKRAGAIFDTGFSDSVPAVGSKRSVRDRLGSSVDAVQLDNKRPRGDNGRWNLKASNGMDDFHLGKDDLRFKIMKRTQSNGQQKTVDLRDMLSRPARPSTTNPGMQQSMPEPRKGRQRVREITPEPRDDRRLIPEPRDDRRRMPAPGNERQRIPDPRDERQHMLDPRDERQRMPEPRDERQRMLESRDDRQRMPEPRDGRPHMPEPIEVRQRMPKLHDVRQHVAEPANGSVTGRVTSTGTSEAASRMDLLRNSYSSWTLDHIRRRSPDRVLDNSRGLSPPRRTDEPQRRPMMRAYEDPRTMAYAGRDVSEISRPMNTASFLTKPTLSAGPTKSVGPLIAPQLPPGGVAQRSQYTVEHNNVEGFLHSLGLDKYLISFKVEEIDMAALSQMGDHDLKELGIPMGPRKKILLALLARARRQAR